MESALPPSSPGRCPLWPVRPVAQNRSPGAGAPSEEKFRRYQKETRGSAHVPLGLPPWEDC